MKIISLILQFFVFVSCVSSSYSVGLVSPLAVDKEAKFTVFLNGKTRKANIVDIEKLRTSFCVLENFKLSNIKLSRGSMWEYKEEKIIFPNPMIDRYLILSTNDYSLYCDSSYSKDLFAKPRNVFEKHASRYFQISRSE